MSRQPSIAIKHLRRGTHHFEPGAQHAELAEAHVEGRAREAAVGLLHHHHVDGARQRRPIDLVVKLPEVRDELPYIVHRIHGDTVLYHFFVLIKSTILSLQFNYRS